MSLLFSSVHINRFCCTGSYVCVYTYLNFCTLPLVQAMILLTLLLSFLDINTGTVYIVTPDDHHYPNTTCHHCHNLQHYLLNVTKYFTSNTQLVFLPGTYYLNFSITIQNVNNISLIGNGTTLVSTVHNDYAITITDSCMITIKNFVFSISPFMLATPFLYFKNSLYVST